MFTSIDQEICPATSPIQQRQNGSWLQQLCSFATLTAVMQNEVDALAMALLHCIPISAKASLRSREGDDLSPSTAEYRALLH
jgi:hypothetical protein